MIECDCKDDNSQSVHRLHQSGSPAMGIRVSGRIDQHGKAGGLLLGSVGGLVSRVKHAPVHTFESVVEQQYTVHFTIRNNESQVLQLKVDEQWSSVAGVVVILESELRVEEAVKAKREIGGGVERPHRQRKDEAVFDATVLSLLVAGSVLLDNEGDRDDVRIEKTIVGDVAS